jgi:hypothetical protein
MKDHRLIDERSLAFDRLTAEKLAADPSLLEVARKNLDRWTKTCSPQVRPVLLEWREILALPVAQVVDVLLDEGPRGSRLRQSSPFAGILNQAERTEILKEFESRESAAA